jgi:hypothetical protein
MHSVTNVSAPEVVLCYMSNSSALPLFMLNLTLKLDKPGAFGTLVTSHKAVPCHLEQHRSDYFNWVDFCY